MKDLSLSPIFIVGAKRSGTTLLRLILNAHPDLCIPDESRVLTQFIDFAPYFNNLEDHTSSKKFLSFFLKHPNIQHWHIPTQQLIDNFNEIGLANTLAYVYLYLAQKSGKLRWGDKTPQNVYHIHKLMHTFPNAKMIHLIRDGRDVISSNLQAFPWTNVYYLAKDWSQIIESMSQINSSQLTQIYYEDLISDPESTLQNLCSFLDLKYTHSMLDYHDSQDALKTKVDAKHHQNVTQKIKPQNKHVYKTRLSAKQIQIIESVCFQALTRHHYTPENAKPISIHFSYRFMSHILFGIKFSIYRTLQLMQRIYKRQLWITLRFNYFKLKVMLMKKYGNHV